MGFALIFRPHVALSDWNEATLKTVLVTCFFDSVQIEFACKDDQLTLNQFIQLAIYTPATFGDPDNPEGALSPHHLD